MKMTRKAKMPARTLKALKASIEKWRKNENGDFQGTGSDNCPLCLLFHSEENPKVHWDACCHGCPVYGKTKTDSCDGTPYRAAIRAKITHGWDSRQFRAAAKRERIFLESLLPKETKK